MSIGNCTYIIPKLIFSAADVESSESVRSGQSYCNITMNTMQGILLPKGLSTFVSNNILYFKNDTTSIKTLRLGFNIQNSILAQGTSIWAICGSCFTLTGVMRLKTHIFGSGFFREFLQSDTVNFVGDNGSCSSVGTPDLNVYKTAYINNDGFKPIVLNPNESVGFCV